MKTELSLSTLQGQGVFKSSELPATSEVTRKTYTVGDITTIDGDERVFSTVMTTGNEDREGEVVIASGIDTKEYNNNPVLCWGHIYSTPPVGKAVEVAPFDNGLAGKFKMASTPFANDLWTLVKDGMLNAVSIGYIRLQTYKRGQPGFAEACRQFGVKITDTLQRITTKAVLVETSLVCTPCNRDAIVFAVAAKGLLEAANRLGIDVQSDDDSGDMIITKAANLSVKPYPTEHAARQESPDAFVKFRRVNNAFGEGIHAIYGIDSHGKTHVQTIRFDVTKFTVSEARTWLKDHGYETTIEAATPQKQEAVVIEPTDIKKEEEPAMQGQTKIAPVEPVKPTTEAKETVIEKPEETAKVEENKPAEEATTTENKPTETAEGDIAEQAKAAVEKTETVETTETPKVEEPKVEESKVEEPKTEMKPKIKIIRLGPKPLVKVLRVGGYTAGDADLKIAKSLHSGKVL